MGNVIGIDLGTTNSCEVVLEGETPVTIPNQEGARTTPSIVAFASNGERLVGQMAKRQAITNPKKTVYGVKRLLGRRFDSAEVRKAREICPYKIVEALNGDAHVQIDDTKYSPAEIEAVLLSKLKAAAENYLGEPVDEAIISVPAYFNDCQRQATKDAGTIAGLEVRRILNEATAAAVACGLSEGLQGRIAIYDLGGGTFDVSIVELADGIFQVLATGGDTYLGGQDFDEIIVSWLVEEFRKEHGIDLSGDSAAVQRLKEAAEKAKCELSTEAQTEILLPYISANPDMPQHLNTVLTRTRFEKMIEPMLDYTAKLCEDLLRDVGLRASDIVEVIAVGGQTRTPAVMETLQTIFGQAPNNKVNPDEAVAIGTAIQTGILQGEVTDLVLLDVTPHTLGIETKDGTFMPLVERNSTIPLKKSRIFTTVVDNQRTVEVHALQGEGTMAHENTSLARFMLSELPPAPAGEPQIEVTLGIDVNGIVNVTAMDQSTGRLRGITVHPTSGLTKSEIEQARKDFQRQTHFEENLGERDRVAAQLDGLVRSTRKSLGLLECELSDQDRQETDAALRQGDEARESSIEQLRSALSNLESTAVSLGQAMLRQPRRRGFFGWIRAMWKRFWSS